jgi:hypothetical protein
LGGGQEIAVAFIPQNAQGSGIQRPTRPPNAIGRTTEEHFIIATILMMRMMHLAAQLKETISRFMNVPAIGREGIRFSILKETQ